MLRVCLKILLLTAVHLPLLCAEKSPAEDATPISGRDKVESDSCGKDCKDRPRVGKRSTPKTRCELYYFAPTAREGELFGFWNNTKFEHLEAYRKIVPFLQENPHEDKPIFFPAHLPLVEKRDGGLDALVLKDVYVRAQGICANIPEANDPKSYDTNPAWYENEDLRLHEEVEMLEDYVERMPRSHWGYRVPKPAEEDVCLDDTGLVVKDFPGIRTCFSMWIIGVGSEEPKHFAGRQIYNRINQTRRWDISAIDFDSSAGESRVEPLETESFSLAALFLKETCYVTNASLENRCTYWTATVFYVSLCCCYTNRTECAYRNFKFPYQKKHDDTVIRACATGEYYLMKEFGGNHEPKNASAIASSVKEFVQNRTSAEICKWTYIWDPRDETPLESVLRVEFGAQQRANITANRRTCTSKSPTCCHPTTTLCPLDANSSTNAIAVECFCSDGDLCNHRHSQMDQNRVGKFKEARPCETHTVYEHIFSPGPAYTNRKHRFMCPIFYNFAHPGRPNAFLQLLHTNNLEFFKQTVEADKQLFKEDGCTLIEVKIREGGDCREKLFGDHDQLLSEVFLILLCSVEGNPLGVRRPSYPDAELKKTIEANLTSAKEAFPTCKNGSWSLDFKKLSELVVDNSKLHRLFHDIADGTNDNITTVHCYVEVSFAYQKQYNFTFGAVSIDNKPLQYACQASEDHRLCMPHANSVASDEHQHYTCCCPRHHTDEENWCNDILLERLTPLLNWKVLAKTRLQIMSELTKDPLMKCVEPEKTNAVQPGPDINRPCARNEGCYSSVHARDVPTSSLPKEYGGCVSEYAPDSTKRYNKASDEVEARFSRICRLARNHGQCFAVLGTEDPDLPDDVKGPQMVCCCGGQLGSAQKCGTGQPFGRLIGDFH